MMAIIAGNCPFPARSISNISAQHAPAHAAPLASPETEGVVVRGRLECRKRRLAMAAVQAPLLGRRDLPQHRDREAQQQTTSKAAAPSISATTAATCSTMPAAIHTAR